MSARICVESGAVCKSLHCATVCVLRLERQDAPPATSAELVALIEAVDTLLESAPCECPHRMREEQGEHLSHCYLFDLNVARSGAGEKR